MTWADTTAVVTAIKTVPSLAIATYVTLAPKPTPPATALPLPYVIVHPNEGTDDTDRVTGPRVTSHPEFTLHIVGGSANSVQITTGLVKALFVSAGIVTAPAVAARQHKHAYWRSPMPIQIDRDVTPWLVYQVIELGWESDPA